MIFFQQNWTDAENKELLSAHLRGLSNAQIADKLSLSFGRKITRNSVAGKLRRLNIVRHQPSDPPPNKRIEKVG